MFNGPNSREQFSSQIWGEFHAKTKRTESKEEKTRGGCKTNSLGTSSEKVERDTGGKGPKQEKEKKNG